MADVCLSDKDGNEIAKTIGTALDVPEDGSSRFSVSLFDGDDFLSKEQIDSIATYEIASISTAEGLDYAVEKKKQEADKAENELRAMS